MGKFEVILHYDILYRNPKSLKESMEIFLCLRLRAQLNISHVTHRKHRTVNPRFAHFLPKHHVLPPCYPLLYHLSWPHSSLDHESHVNWPLQINGNPGNSSYVAKL